MKSKQEAAPSAFSRRDLLLLTAQVAGGAVMYQAMSSLGFAAESTYQGAMRLEGKPREGASVLVLGAGVAGMLAAYELRKAGYKVTILEYREKAGGRCWSLRGGDTYTELGNFTQKCEFDNDMYLNPGPWRIPYHHHAVLDYCRRFGVALEPFVELNHNAYLHSKNAFGGKPQRLVHISTDFRGHAFELLAKAVNQNKLDEPPGREDREKLLEALRSLGALDKDYRYKKGPESSVQRGFAVDPGGGLMPAPRYSQPLSSSEVLQSGLWAHLVNDNLYEYQTTMFQPTGGIDMIAQAFAREVGSLIRYNTRVSKIAQNESGVTVTCTDLKTKDTSEVKADWCVCTIPLSILSQLEVQVGGEMKAAIDAVPYETGFKAGIQFKRRFWEEDDRIYGGISYTDLPINRISYPISGLNRGGKGVLQAAYTFGPDSYKFSSLPPAERLREVLLQGARIHPQYPQEFDNGISVGWHRVPWTNGCYGLWTERTRAEHYENLCRIDGRIVLAGEHASRIPAWLEGAFLSSMDAVERLHKRVLAG